MIQHFLKVALRNIWKYKTFSLLNVTGLAIGMAGTMMLLLWIQNQVSIDQFHAKKEKLFKIYANQNIDGQIQTNAQIPFSLFASLQTDFPEVRQVTKVIPDHKSFQFAENKLNLSGNRVDASFLNMFSFPLVLGDKETALNYPASILITERVAKLFFLTENPLNKIFTADGKQNYIVKGILKDLPNNTQFNFDYLISGSNATGSDALTVFVELVDQTNLQNLNHKLNAIDSINKANFFAYPLRKLWLESHFENGRVSGGAIDTIRIIGLIAAIILFMACVNFVNLSTARSIKRSKEVGIRKVLGSGKRLLIWQFIGESICLSFIAGIIALGILGIALPFFNILTEKQLTLELSSVYFWIAFIVFILITGMLAGTYPAFFLSSFKPVKALKGIIEKRPVLLTPRKVLFVFQFIVAVVLINFTIILKKQMSHVRDRETGFDKSNLVFQYMTDDLQKNYAVVQNTLLQSGAVSSMSASDASITGMHNTSNQIVWKGKKETADFQIGTTSGNYIKTNGLTLVSGRDIDLNQYPNDTASCVINETAMSVLGFDEPVGKVLQEGSNDYRIIGVVKDFVNVSPFQAVDPVIIKGSYKNHFINFRMNTSNSLQTDLSKILEVIKSNNINFVTELKFADDEYANKTKGLLVTARLTNIFAGIAIFISCLGLLGLVMFAAESRAKEMSIRKVFGAGVTEIVFVLSKDFVRLVCISITIASPIGWLLMSSFLRPLYYRTSLNIWILVGAGSLALLITVLTVGLQATKTAFVNPVKNLRAD
jgi:putative ABC transport system permease protein